MNSMQNGMEKDSLNYKLVVGNSNTTLLKELLKIYTLVFEDADVDFFKTRFNEHPEVISVLVYHKNKLIGFKIGYPYDEDTFYSWIGGVLSDFRQKGIAENLAKQLELAARSLGFRKLRTKSMNKFKPMMILNLKRGFDIVSIYTNEAGQTKIIFEKEIDLQ